MNAEIIAIGTELLQGVTVDTNSAYVAQQLGNVGIVVRHVTLVGDDWDDLVAAIRQAHARSALVICEGGLGPTGDDLTREAIAEALGQPLEFHQSLLDDIAARFAAFKRTMSPSNRNQAFVPQGAHIIRNPRGTAPSFVAEHEGGMVAALPGVPSELQWLTENALLPYLREHGADTVRVIRELRISGVPEATAGERIAEFFNQPNPVVGITAKAGQLTVRIAAVAATPDDATALIAPIAAAVVERFGDHLLDDERLEERVGRLLAAWGGGLCLHENNVLAPVFRLVTTTPGGRAAIAKGGAWIERSVAPITEQTVRAAADAVLHRAGSASPALGLAIIAEEPDAQTFIPVHLALTDGNDTEYIVRSFDFGSASGPEILAASTLEMLRRHLESASRA